MTVMRQLYCRWDTVCFNSINIWLAFEGWQQHTVVSFNSDRLSVLENLNFSFLSLLVISSPSLSTLLMPCHSPPPPPALLYTFCIFDSLVCVWFHVPSLPVWHSECTVLNKEISKWSYWFCVCLSVHGFSCSEMMKCTQNVFLCIIWQSCASLNLQQQMFE